MALRRITLRDFVIVQTLDLDLADGFTVLTGETGAGKSILIDALQLVMGARADAHAVREGCTRADITAQFDTIAPVLPLLDAYGIEPDSESSLLLRRSIDSQGKSRAWINGTPATATQLRELGSLLVDIHGQHAWQSLMHPASIRLLLDAYGRIPAEALQVPWAQWHALQAQLEAAQSGLARREEERERLQWQVAELDRLAPQPGEWDTLNAEHQRLSHAQQLLESARQAIDLLDAEEVGVQHGLRRAAQTLADHASIEPRFQEWIELLESSQTQLQETLRGLGGYLDRVEWDPEQLAQLDQRLGSWLSLARRLRLAPESLPSTWHDWKQALQALEDDIDVAALETRVTQAREAYLQEAEHISQLRRKAGAQLAVAITAAMQELGMEGGRFEVSFLPAPPSATGTDTIDFLVSGHSGSSPRPIAKVASGGELSRISLAIAVTTSKLGQAPTLIFDEVDAGVGGIVAHTVGRMMRQLGQDRQVLAVTHLPQVAASAHHHLRVSKAIDPQDHATVSHTEPLDDAGRAAELARMLGGEPGAATPLAHAREMLKTGQATGDESVQTELFTPRGRSASSRTRPS